VTKLENFLNGYLLSKTMSQSYNTATDKDLSFGLSMLNHIEGNAAISPISLRTTLAILAEGATGATAKQLFEKAYIPENTQDRQAGFKQVRTSLNASQVPFTLRSANGLWIANEYNLNPEYRKTVMDTYGAVVQSANFLEQAYEVTQDINGWVGKQTEEKIPNLFGPGAITPLTTLVLANALYFKAPWADKFNAKYTQKQDFRLANGETVKVDMMRKGEIDGDTLPKFMYHQFDGAQIVMLPYEGYQLAKIVILPPQGTDIKGLEEQLRVGSVDIMDLQAQMTKLKFARLELPRHELKGDYDLQAPFEAMGIDRLFSPGASELNNIGNGHLFVDKGIHKTYFKTNEEGSEGAAATGVVTRTLSMDMKKPIEFVADRPFLEAIVDNSSGAVLFLNRVVDPR
jgi:serpin B